MSFGDQKITANKTRKMLFKGCYYTKKLVLQLPDGDTLIKQSLMYKASFPARTRSWEKSGGKLQSDL